MGWVEYSEKKQGEGKRGREGGGASGKRRGQEGETGKMESGGKGEGEVSVHLVAEEERQGGC